MDEKLTLNDIIPGFRGIITDIDLKGKIKDRLSDIGLHKGALITCVGESMFKNPKAYNILGTVIAIRNEDSKKIYLNSVTRVRI